MGIPVIEATALVRHFRSGRGRKAKTVEAVRGIDLHIEAGERLAYIGPNGAGKSTSIKMLTGILHPTSGSASVLGHVPWDDRRELARHIGALFGQRSQLWAELSPRQSLHMLAAIYDLDAATERRRIGDLAELLDAADLLDQPARSLSLGQRMRCELAACLLHDPAILFLDEPTIGLDLLAKQRFRSLLVELNASKGTTIFLTSHDVADIEHVAERVLVINHGTVIYDDTVAAMRGALLATKLIDVGLTEPCAPVVLDGVTTLEHSTTLLRLSVDTSRRSVRDVLDVVLDTLPVGDIGVADPPLDDVIASIYRAPIA